MCDYFEKEPETEAFEGNIITCVLKIQNGKVIRYDVRFSALNQQRSKNIQPEPGKNNIRIYGY